jgi:hypothetical protein
VSSGDAKNVFAHLHAAGLIESKDFKVPKIGGAYSVESGDNHAKLVLNDHGNTFINGKQLVILLAKIREFLGDDAGQLETDPSAISSDKNTKYKLKMRLGLS